MKQAQKFMQIVVVVSAAFSGITLNIWVTDPSLWLQASACLWLSSMWLGIMSVSSLVGMQAIDQGNSYDSRATKPGGASIILGMVATILLMIWLFL